MRLEPTARLTNQNVDGNVTPRSEAYIFFLLYTATTTATTTSVLYRQQAVALVCREIHEPTVSPTFFIGYMNLLTRSKTKTAVRQARGFELQFELAERSGLPVFFHSRACREDFADLVRRNRDRISGGVVHSFTGSIEEMEELVSMGG